MIIFFDNIGRTIIGSIQSETDDKITVANPCAVQIGQHPATKEITMQLLPMVLFELIDIDNTKSYSIEFNKNNISILKDHHGEYAPVADKFIKIRKALFDRLENGTLSEIMKQAQNSNTNQATPQIIEAK